MNNNICKYSIMQSSDLVCHKFIYETTDIMKDSATSEHHILGIVTKGSGTVTINGDASVIQTGDLFLICKGDVFSVCGENSLEYSYIAYLGRRADELIERMGMLREERVIPAPEGMADFWMECLKKSDNGNLDLFSEAVLLYTFAHIDSLPVDDKTDVVSKIMTYTADNYTDPYLSLAGMAVDLGYDAKYLSHQFVRKKGIPYTAYLRSLRIKHSIFLFEQGMLSVKNVAIMSGFSDALYFSKVFKQEIGVTPKEYISSLIEDIS